MELAATAATAGRLAVSRGGGCFGLVMTLLWAYLFVSSLIEHRWIFAACLAALLAVLIVIQLAATRQPRRH